MSEASSYSTSQAGSPIGADLLADLQIDAEQQDLPVEEERSTDDANASTRRQIEQALASSDLSLNPERVELYRSYMEKEGLTSIDGLISSMFTKMFDQQIAEATQVTKRKKKKKKKKSKKSKRRGSSSSSSSSSSFSSGSDNDHFRVKFGRKSMFSPKNSANRHSFTYSNQVQSTVPDAFGDIKDGGVGRIGSSVVPFSGYDPLLKANFWLYDPVEKEGYVEGNHDATLPDIVMPCHDLMARPTNSKHRHAVLESIKKWPYDRQFSGQIANARNYLNVYTMTQFLAEFLDWTIKTGTVRQFELTHPVLNTVFNVIINPYLVKPDMVKKLYEEKYSSPDQNDTENAHLTTEFTSKAFKGTIITQLQLKLPYGTAGCVLFSYAMWHLQHVSFSMITNKKNALRGLKLTNYPEENVTLFARDVLEHYQAIDMFDHVDPELLVSIARSFESGRDDRFRHFAFGKTTEWKRHAEQLRYQSFQTIMSYEDFKSGSKAAFNIREKVNEYVEEYTALIHSGHYAPAQKPRRAPPPHANLSELQANTLTQNPLPSTPATASTPTSSQLNDPALFKSHCTQCGKPKSECAKTQKDKKGSADQSWRTKKKGSTYKLGVFVLKWCNKCGENGSYRFHDDSGHAKFLQGRERRKKFREKRNAERTSNTGPTANLATVGTDHSEGEPLYCGFVTSGSSVFGS